MPCDVLPGGQSFFGALGNASARDPQVTCRSEHAGGYARKTQKTLARGACSPGRSAIHARSPMNDLHGKNARRGSNAQVKSRARARRNADRSHFRSFRDVHRWHMRCSFTDRVKTQKERNAMKLPAMLAGTTAGLLLAGLAVAQGPAIPPPQPSMTQPATDMTARHTMTGEVTSGTPDKGRVLVTTPEGRMLLRFP